jgi:mRNA interferase RelE/StbE
MALALLFTTLARKQYEKLPPQIQGRVAAALEHLAVEPLSGKPLQGELRGDRSHRVGEYRIVYTPEPALQRLVVLRIAHRREVYRR